MEHTLTAKQKSFIDDCLHPALHGHLDELLPHLFDSSHGTYDEGRRAWKSKYHLDDGTLDGKYTTWAPSHLHGKSTFYLLYDFGHGGIPREVLGEIANLSYNGMRSRAIEDLSRRYGLEKEYIEMYRKEITPEMQKHIEEEEQTSVDLSTARDIFVKAIWDESDGEASKALKYMRERGWSDDDIREGEIGLITASIKAKVNEATKGRIAKRWNEAIGDTHTIAIPLYVNGRMSAFQFRTIAPESEIEEKGWGKYQYENVPKSYFYGFYAGARNIVITEGILDYIHSNVKKFPNIITSGGTPGNEQITNLLKYADYAQSYTLFVDADKGGRKHINKLSNAIIARGRKDTIRIAFMEPIEGESPKDIDEWIGIMNARGMDSLDMYNKSIANSIVYDEWKPIDIELSFAEGILLKGENDRKKRNRGFTCIDPEMIGAIGAMASKEEIRDFKREMKQFFRQCDKEYIDEAINHWKPWETLLKCDIRALITSEEEIIIRAKNEAIQSNVKRLYGAWKDSNPVEMRKHIEELYSATNPMDEPEEKMWGEYGVKAVSPFTSKEAIEDYQNTERDGIPTCITFTDGTTEHIAPFMLEPGLTFLCANTSHGKTSILNRIAVDEAVRNRKMGTDKGVMYFTYEIDKRPLIRDLLCIYVDDANLSKSPRRTIKSYFKTRDDSKFAKTFYDEKTTHYNHFIQKKDEFLEHFIRRGGYINLIEEALSCESLIKVVESYIKQTKRRHDEGLGKDISIICLDYAQLLFSDEELIRTEEISTICKKLNDLGRKYQIPIVMPAQFNQSVLSPFHMDIRCIGEGGGFSRYGVAVLGFFNLGFLRRIGKEADDENAKILKKLGIEFNGDVGGIPGIMYAKAMKLRNEEWVPCETLLLWDSKLKTIIGNTNPYIANPSLAKVDGMSIRTAIEKGRGTLRATAQRMMKVIGEVKNENGGLIAKSITKPEDILKTLSDAIIGDEDNYNEHPEYFEGREGNFAENEEPQSNTNEGEPEEIDVWSPDFIPDMPPF